MIGVILMVAVTVLLAAVVGTFVMNMDMPENQPPSASWDISEGTDAVIIEHDGGESASAEELVAVVSYTGTSISNDRITFTDGGYSAGDKITATDSFTIYFTGSSGPPSISTGESINDVKEVRLIWESSTSTQTQPLTTWEN
ncbi:conserved hypothetical protein (DUF1628) [Halorhabdus tiamatea SARL4B]|uniref:Archaeal Type IV pilin N-terminal domain-containing protein n=1 Tax=Halorhabdus tiamatea SARL4B TaxID=1033806 RepID=F7PG86_9EURY|nr:conserved hypothetical protein (DUF1628) [Halorhabdus tiamatea SARL4B]